MAYHPCRHCGGKGYTGPIGFPSGQGDICCDGGVYSCDDCECEITGDMIEDGDEHFCEDCRSVCEECGGVFFPDDGDHHGVTSKWMCHECIEEQDDE